MLTHSLLLVFSLILAGVAAFFAMDSRRYAARCENHANRLRTMLARVTAAEGAIESLQHQVQKLRGQFFAFKAEFAPVPLDETEPEPHGDQHRLDVQPAYCENYQRAQVDGPLSPAAQCPCGYCIEMRDRRALARRMLPKTAADRVALVKGSAK